MATVPISGPRQLLSGQAPKPSETEMMMALAEMNGQGRLAPGPTTSTPDPNAQRSTNRKTAAPLK